jgi:hypothetical protein
MKKDTLIRCLYYCNAMNKDGNDTFTYGRVDENDVLIESTAWTFPVERAYYCRTKTPGATYYNKLYRVKPLMFDVVTLEVGKIGRVTTTGVDADLFGKNAKTIDVPTSEVYLRISQKILGAMEAGALLNRCNGDYITEQHFDKITRIFLETVFLAPGLSSCETSELIQSKYKTIFL